MSVEMIRFKVRLIIEPDGDSFHGYCPELKGLHVSGESEDEALQMLKDAASTYLHSLLAHRDPIPLGLSHQRYTFSWMNVWKSIRKLWHAPKKHCHVEVLSLT